MLLQDTDEKKNMENASWPFENMTVGNIITGGSANVIAQSVFSCSGREAVAGLEDDFEKR